MLEAGPVARVRDFKKDAGYTLSRYFWHGGMRTTTGNLFMPTMQARNVGGGSVWNSAICLRIPEFTLERWEQEHGLTGFTKGGLDRHFEAVEAFMGVRPVEPDCQGPRNELFRQACEKMGWGVLPIERNEAGCLGSGECFTGCPNGAKLSVDRRGLPEVIERGGVVYASVQCDKLIMQGREVRGCEGHVVHPKTGKKSHKVRIEARCTLVAAGTIHTPDILQRSGIRGPGIGNNLRFHPGTMVMGLFDDPVFPWAGATQGYHCLDFLESDGIKLESLWATPSLMAFRFPGFGKNFQKLLGEYTYMASWDAWVSGEDSVGSVKATGLGRPSVRYQIHQNDVDRVAEAMAKLSELFFAVGAKGVLLGVHGLPDLATDARIIDTLRNTRFSVDQFPLASNHAFGATPMGADPSRHGVDPTGAVYGADHVYVCDTGLLPNTPSANPMMPAMGLSHYIAENVLGRYT
ncbi:MAG: GMC family oxidoreductase [Deltaproteobacteria bacterium]|nr:MAG: GMC family oxidoreductase [Deltaproteobacteria bacterium]